MKKTTIFAFAVLFASSIYAATDDATNNAATANDSANTAATSNTAQNNQVSQNANENSDAQSLAYLIVIDNSEVTAGKAALKKDLSSNVAAFAKHMVQDHSKHLKATIALSHKLHIKPAKSEAVENLKEKNKDGLADLKNMKGKEFETAYVNAMVKGHTEALNLIKNNLLPQATNPDVKQYLENTSKTVQEHLDMAKSLQSNMQTASQ